MGSWIRSGSDLVCTLARNGCQIIQRRGSHRAKIYSGRGLFGYLQIGVGFCDILFSCLYASPLAILKAKKDAKNTIWCSVTLNESETLIDIQTSAQFVGCNDL